MTEKTFSTHPLLWNPRRLLFANGLAALLIFSLFSPITQDLWKALDVHFFLWINQPLVNSPSLRMFWAMANHRLADWLEDVCFLGFFFIAIFRTSKNERKRISIQLCVSVLLTTIAIILINRILCRDLLRVRRLSPTYMLEEAVVLSDFISWMSVKVDSAKSFPGDHATTALMVTMSYAYIVRGRLALIALLYGGFLCLPRLAVGAHWLSDILIGSFSIVLVTLSWAFFTPFFSWITSRFVKNPN